MLNETSFIWHTWHTNGIPSNPIQFWYCIVDHGDGTGKMYVVEPHYAQDPSGFCDTSAGYKYFVFCDCNVKLATPEEQKEPFCWNYSGYVMTSKSFIAIFDTPEDAKKRAYTQYAHHFGYVLPHMVDDVDAVTAKHFVV